MSRHWVAFEIYAGDADAIGEACKADRWTELRSGSIVENFVLFRSSSFNPGELLLIADAIAELVPDQSVPYDEVRTIVNVADERLGVVVVSPAWVRSVAAIDIERVELLRDRYRDVYQREYASPPEWHEGEALDLLARLIWVCRKASEQTLDVVYMWWI